MVDCESFERLNTDRATKVIPLDAVIMYTDPNQYNILDAYADGSLGFIIPSEGPNQSLGISKDDEEVRKRGLVKPLTEDQYILCNSRVRGFALAQKQWGGYLSLSLLILCISPSAKFGMHI